MKGIIAIDIDGTLTSEKSEVPPRVIHYLKVISSHYHLIFVTGRAFHWAYQSLHLFDFPYALALQNGAYLLIMPERKIILKNTLNKSILLELDLICSKEPSDYVIYSGFENQDICYYRPDRFEKTLLHYVNERAARLKEIWIDTESFDNIVDEFASIKCFGERENLEKMGLKMEKRLKLHAPLVRDPMHESYCVLQATHSKAAKGDVLQSYIDHLSFKGVVIAAGDDENDRSMLQRADIKVVMESAPLSLKAIADVIAPSASHGGLVEGLKEVIQ